MTAEEIIKNISTYPELSELKNSDPKLYRKYTECIILERFRLIMPFYKVWQNKSDSFAANYVRSLPPIIDSLNSIDFNKYEKGLEAKKELTEEFYLKCIAYGADEIVQLSKEFDKNTELKVINLINRTFKKYYSNRVRIINNLVKFIELEKDEASKLQILAYIPFKNPTIGIDWMKRWDTTELLDLLHDWQTLLCIDSKIFISDEFISQFIDIFGEECFKRLLDKLLIYLANENNAIPIIYKPLLYKFKKKYNKFKCLLQQYKIVEDIAFKELTITRNAINFYNCVYPLNKRLSSLELSVIKDNIKINKTFTLLVEKKPINEKYYFRFLSDEDAIYINKEINEIIGSTKLIRKGRAKQIGYLNNKYNKESFVTNHSPKDLDNQLVNDSIRLIANNVKASDLIINPGAIYYTANDGKKYCLKSVRIISNYQHYQLEKIDHVFTLVKDKIRDKEGEDKQRFLFEPVNDFSFLLSELERLNKIYYLPESQDFPLYGTFELPWNYVKFYDGIMYLMHPNPSKRGTYYPFNFRHPDILRSYNDIYPYIEARCPMFKVRAIDGIIVEVLNFEEFRKMIPHLKEITQDENIEYSLRNKNNTNYEISSESFREKINKIKSPYLEFLSRIQLDNYKIYYLLENVVHSSGFGECDEYGYLFTIGESINEVKLLYENVSNESRSSLLFSIKSGYYEEGFARIKLFLASEIENKRQKLAWDIINFTDSYIIRVDRIAHTNVHDWQWNINRFIHK